MIPITSAEQLVRHLLKWDENADEIERQLRDSALGRHASLAEWQACKRLLKSRRRYDAGLVLALAEGLSSTEEAIAERLKVGVRTVDGWRYGR